MNRSIAVLACAAVGTLPLTTLAQKTLDLRAPTIVILLDSPAEIERQQHDQEYIEASGDFGVYANRMVIALKSHKRVRIRWVSVDTVRFPGTNLKPVQRREVDGGWGYVFYRPGREPIVYEGVAVDDQLVCIAAKLFEIKVEGYSCGA